jgi:hypothetical protein
VAVVDEVDVVVDADVDAEVDAGVDMVDVGVDAALGPALGAADEGFATAGASGRGALRPPKHATPVSNIPLATVIRRRSDLSIAIDIELPRISGILHWRPRK